MVAALDSDIPSQDFQFEPYHDNRGAMSQKLLSNNQKFMTKS